MTKEIKWQDPPATNYGGVRDFVRELAKNPGRWAYYKRYAKKNIANSASNYLKRRYKVESVSRGTDVYVRWVGEDSER